MRTVNADASLKDSECPDFMKPVSQGGGCNGKLIASPPVQPEAVFGDGDDIEQYADAAAAIAVLLGVPDGGKPGQIVQAVKLLLAENDASDTRAERNENATAAIEREVGNRYKTLIDTVAECLGTVSESGYVPAFGEPLTNQLRRAWRAVSRNGESAIVAHAVDDKIDNICKLTKAKHGGDAGVILHTRRDGFKATAVSGIPVAGGEGFLSQRGLTVEAALDNLEEVLCYRIGAQLDKLGSALKDVERSRHPLITLDPALEKIDAE
jgi:hypothetical protein